MMIAGVITIGWCDYKVLLEDDKKPHMRCNKRKTTSQINMTSIYDA